MPGYRLFVYSGGLVLPIIIPLDCAARSINRRLARVFSQDRTAWRAEIWLGSKKILDLDFEAILCLVQTAEARAWAISARPEKPGRKPRLH